MHGRRMTTLATAALAFFTGVATFGAVGAQAATDTQPSPGVTMSAGAPCFVSGYSYHARQQMQARGISSEYVDEVVRTQCGNAKWQKSNQTWLYTTRYIGVVTNTNGWVVTVFRR